MIDNLMYALYIVLGIAPFSVIQVYPFYNKLRISPKYYWRIFSSILVIEVILFIVIEKYNSVSFISNNEFMRLIFYFIYLVISIIAIKESPCKHLIVWAICMIFSSTFTAFTFWMDFIFPFPIPFLIKNITTIVLLPFFLWIVFRFINRRIMLLINQSNKKLNSLICALLILIFTMGLITARELPYNDVKTFAVFFVRVVACVITVIVCYIFSEIIKRQNENLEIIEDNKQKEKILDVSTEQFIILSDKIEQIRRLRYNFKLHISAIKELIYKQDYKSLLEYIENDNLVPSDEIFSLCNNLTLNVILSYYSDMAKANNTEFKVVANTTNRILLTNSEIWSLLGNLLENSIEAIKYVDEKNRLIRVSITANEMALALTVDNSFNPSNLRKSGENFISTKDRDGTGLKSISCIAEKYNGVATFEVKDDCFLSAVTIYK